jgi:hypothetical protein
MHIRGHFALAKRALAGIEVLIPPNPISTHRRFVEQPVVVDPVLNREISGDYARQTGRLEQEID